MRNLRNALPQIGEDDAAWLDIALRAALAGAAAIATVAAVRSSGEADLKPDGSPVTRADLAADAAIRAVLGHAASPLPIVSEEVAAEGWSAPIVWMVDPLDGTKEFVAGRGDYTVNVALIAHGVPRIGVVVQPEADRLYAGVVGQGAIKAQIAGEELGEIARLTCRRPGASLVAVASRSHCDTRTRAFLDAHGIVETCALGSSLKFCCLAEGNADVYPRLAPTMAWDTAAAHAVLLGAGGAVVVAGGQPLSYAADRLRNPSFVAVGSPDLAARLDLSLLDV